MAIEQEIAITFDDMGVISEDDLDVFLYNWNLELQPPPYYITVEGRRFAFTGQTLLIKGHGAALRRAVHEHEAEGRLAILVERNGRYLIYAHDPNATDDDGDE